MKVNEFFIMHAEISTDVLRPSDASFRHLCDLLSFFSVVCFFSYSISICISCSIHGQMLACYLAKQIS